MPGISGTYTSTRWTGGIPALATLGILAAVLATLIAYEARRFAELRERLRHQLAPPPAPS